MKRCCLCKIVRIAYLHHDVINEILKKNIFDKVIDFGHIPFPIRILCFQLNVVLS